MAKCSKCEKEFKNLGVHERFCKGIVDEDVTDLVATKEERIEVKPDDKVITAINNLTSLVKNLAERVEEIEKPVIKQAEEQNKYVPAQDETYPDKRKPTQYRRIVDEILSTEFDFDVEDIDPHNFQFTIYVPNKFSSLTAEDKEKGMKDIRSRIIPIIVGENGVTDWCKKIKENLSKYLSENKLTQQL